MKNRLGFLLILIAILTLFVAPMFGQAEPADTDEAASETLALHWLAIAMGIAAAGCGIAQSRAVAGGCDGVSRNPGAADSIRFFVILGLAFIEFLALLTFVLALMLYYI